MSTSTSTGESPLDAVAAPDPSPARQVLRRLAGAPAAAVDEALACVRGPDTELQDFRPLAQSLEWQLADAYWSSAGALPFVRNDVPYLVNNSGRLSEGAAELVFAAWCERAASLPARLVVFELGAGTGLFARYFLDALAARCRAEGRDFYDRLTYVVSDRFVRTVQGWNEDGIFDGHAAHVEARVCDASQPESLSLPGGTPAAGLKMERPPGGGCHYVL